MADETVTIQEAMGLLGRSEKRVRMYIQEGRFGGELGPDNKYHLPLGPDGKYHISKDKVLQLAKHPAQIQADKLDKLSRRVDQLETRLFAIEQLLEALTTRLDTLTSLPVVETPTYTPQPRRKRAERQETDVAASTTGNVPEGYVVYPHFLHGVPDSTAKRYIGEEPGPDKFTITEGSWLHNGHLVGKLLSPGQQHEYYLALHNHPRFQTCPDCPHNLE